jgi:hypothetical protein
MSKLPRGTAAVIIGCGLLSVVFQFAPVHGQQNTTPLFAVDTATPPDRCIPGEVTTNSDHKGCKTKAIGSAVPVGEGVAHRLVAGVDANVSEGSVSIIKNHLGGQTRFIGYSHDSFGSGTALYLGIEPNCNLGVVSTASDHRGCPTIPIGFAVK